MERRGKQELHLLNSIACFFLGGSFLTHGALIRGWLALLAGGGFFILTIMEIKRQRSRK